MVAFPEPACEVPRAVRPRQPRAFTLVELLVVMSIIALLIAVASPRLIATVRGSNLDITVQTTLKALAIARLEAINYRLTVAVYFGDENSHFKQPLTAGVLPKPGQITVFTQQNPGYFYKNPVTPGYDPSPAWYPYRFPQIDVTDAPFAIPDGVRVISGRYWEWNNRKVFSFPYYHNDAIGELKRHHAVIYRDGSTSIVTYVQDYYAYSHLLVFDEKTGAHVVIEVGDQFGARRPRVLKDVQLTHIGSNPVKKFEDIGTLIDSYPANDVDCGTKPNL